MKMRTFIVIGLLALILVWFVPASGQIPYPFMSIQEIQQVDAGGDSSYQAAFPNDTIWTTGIVTCGAGELYAGSNITLYLQDAAGGPWSGLLLFNSDNSAFNVGRGDSVIVIGTVGEYTTTSDSLETGYNIETSMTEIFTTQEVIKEGEGMPLPEVITLTPADLDSMSALLRDAEQYEACRVKVENVVVTSQESAYRQFWVSDDGGWSESCVVRLYADSLYGYPIPPAGSVFESITGVVYHVYGNYTLLCRKPEDLVLATGAPLIGLDYSPKPPTPDDTVWVDATIVDDGDITAATLYFEFGDDDWNDQALQHLGGASYRGYIIPQDAGITVSFYVEAGDDSGYTSTDPEGAPDEAHSYTVMQTTPATIYQVQFTTDPGADNTYPSPLVDELVTVTGVVTADHSVGSDHFYLQDDTDPMGTGGPWNGIFIYDAGDREPAQGDKITLTAQVAEYYGSTELKNIAAYELISSGNDLPAPVEVETGDIEWDQKAAERYEGVYIIVRDVEVVDPEPGHGNFRIDDGSGVAQVDAGDYTYEAQMGDQIEWIRGFLNYTYDEFEIELRGDDDIGPVTQTGVEGPAAEMPLEFALWQNYPNPFNPVTQITYSVPYDTDLKIEIFNILGQKVRTLVNQRVSAGRYTVTWRGYDEAGCETASGIYFCRIMAGDFVQTRKMVLLK
jgi:hypothetical protein